MPRLNSKNMQEIVNRPLLPFLLFDKLYSDRSERARHVQAWSHIISLKLSGTNNGGSCDVKRFRNHVPGGKMGNWDNNNT